MSANGKRDEVGFRGPAEALDVANTCVICPESDKLGWLLRDDVASNTRIQARQDGRVTMTLEVELPADRVKALLATLRDPAREPGTIDDLIRDTLDRVDR